jgi:hypothetical protein
VVDGAILGGDADFEGGGDPAVAGGLVGGGGAPFPDLAAINGIGVETASEFLGGGRIGGAVAQGVEPAAVEKQAACAEIGPLTGRGALQNHDRKRKILQHAVHFLPAGAEGGLDGLEFRDVGGKADEDGRAVGLADGNFFGQKGARGAVRHDNHFFAPERAAVREDLLVKGHEVGGRCGRQEFGIGVPEDFFERVLQGGADFGVGVEVVTGGVFHEDVRIDVFEDEGQQVVLGSVFEGGHRSVLAGGGGCDLGAHRRGSSGAIDKFIF